MSDGASDSRAGGIELAPGVFVPEWALRFQYARSSGPGGQNVNKVNTKAELWIDPAAMTGLSERAKIRLINLAGKRLTTAGEIHISADTERSQESNREAVLARLRLLIIEARHEPKVRRKTKPTRASKQRRVETKKRRAEIKARRQYRSED